PTPELRFAPSLEIRAVPDHVAFSFGLRSRSNRNPPSMSVNEDRAEIVDIGVSRSGLKQVAQAFEKTGRIVFGKKRGRIQAKIKRPGQRGVVDKSTGRIIRATAAPVSAVGVARDGSDAGCRPQRLGERQGVFLIRAAAPFAADGDSEFAARDDD